MVKIRTYFGWTALIASGVLLLVVVGIVLYSRTAEFHDLLRIDADLAGGIATLRGKLGGELGKANWQGEIRLADTPHYRLDLSVEHLDIKKVTAGGEAIESDLNLKATIRGKGLALADMNTRAKVDVLPSRVGPVQVRSGQVNAQVANQRVRIDQGWLVATGTNIAISGQVATKADAPGALSYAVQMDDMGPWLALAGQQGVWEARA